MKHATAIRHLRHLVEALGDDARLARELAGDPPRILATYAFGELLEGADRLELADVALVVNRSARELPWGATPPEVRGFLAHHRLDRVPVRWFCRPADLPVANHRIVRPVRIWSVDGPDEQALEALAARRAAALRPPAGDPEELARQLEQEAATSLAQLDELLHGHRGDPRAVADELFELAWGYTDLRRGLAALHGEEAPAAPAPTTHHVWDHDRYRQLSAAVRLGDGDAVVTLVGDEPLEEVAQVAGEGLLTAVKRGVTGAAAAAERCAGALRERGWEGDEELAEELEAALGVGAIPARRAVPVDLGELGSHLDGGGGPLGEGMNLELATGALWPTFDDYEAMTGEPLPEDWDDPEAWLYVEPQGSGDAYRDMERFAGTVADRRFADRLERALEGRGAFRRFRDVLAERPDEEGRWRVFSDERVRGRARSWLAMHGYRPA